MCLDACVEGLERKPVSYQAVKEDSALYQLYVQVCVPPCVRWSNSV